MPTVGCSALRPFAFALTAAVLVGGCSPAGHTTGSDPLVSAAGASLARTLTTAYSEEHTVSIALDRIDQRELPLDHTYKHYGTGRGVTVYVFDGGVLESHPDLVGRVRRGYNAFPNEDHLCNAHGTAVAGAVAGSTLGVAPAVEIVDVKMVECRTMRGTIDAIVKGSQWMLADHARHPERRAIANWSFIADTSAAIPALDSTVKLLRAAGIPVVVSAGNFDLDACHVSPGNAPGAIVVGASRIRRIGESPGTMLIDARAPGTAYGTCIDVFAPGDSVLLPSMDERQLPFEQLWTGTSMSAGYVSGAIALFLETHPFATADEVSAYVRHSASMRLVVDRLSPNAGMLYVGAMQSSLP